MWSRCSWLTRACCCCVGDRSAKAFLAAKDGPPGFESYPGWLGVCDLGLFAVGLVPALVGFFGYGGDWQDWCCFAGLLFLPHYANDYFCYYAITFAIKQPSSCLFSSRLKRSLSSHTTLASACCSVSSSGRTCVCC
jgi:hypothetical protein